MAVTTDENLDSKGEIGGKLEYNEYSTSPSTSFSPSISLPADNDWQFIYNIEIWHDRSLQFREEKKL